MSYTTVELTKKSASRLMRALDWLMRLVPGTPNDFLSNWWTTLGGVVYVPDAYDDDPDWGTEPWRARHRRVLTHEAVHAAQFERWGWFGMALGYLGPTVVLGLPAALVCLVLGLAGVGWTPLWVALGVAAGLLPLSVGLAWGRWRIEREAYAAEFQFYWSPGRPEWVLEVGLRIGRAARALWGRYFFTWPETWMREWFWAEAEKQRAVRLGARKGARL